MIGITKGENKEITLKIRDKEGDPFDLTNFTKFKVCFPNAGTGLVISEVANANGSVVALSGSAILGKLVVTLNYQDSATLEEGESLDIGVKVNSTAEDNPRSAVIAGELTVYPEVCP